MGIKHPLADCDNCPLKTGSDFCPSDGPAKADLAIVGEAPGRYEALMGRPFVGSSGQLLDRVLKAYNINRKDVFLTNVTLCRPQDNATPPLAAIAACRQRLRSELRERGSNQAVALGGTAAQALLDSRMGVTQLRIGPAKPSPVLPGMEVIPTWHPAYCLRNADAFPALVRDFAKLKGEHRAWDPPDWRAYDDPVQALQVIAAVRDRTNRIAVDIEVGIEKDTSYDHPNEYDLLCLGIAYAADKVIVLHGAALEDRAVLDSLRHLLTELDTTYQNGKFDTSGLYKHLGDLPIGFDTMLASYCLNEIPGGHDLEALAVELLGSPSWKSQIARYVPRGGSYANIPKPILHKYNAYDLANTWRLREYFEPLLKKTNMRGLHDFLCRAAEQLKFLEMNGITIDREYSDKLAITYLGKLEAIEAELDTAVATMTHQVTTGLNPRSPKQIKELFASVGVHTDSTDQDHLEQVQKRFDPESSMGVFLEALLRHRRKQKLYSTYVKGIRKRMYRGRVYTIYSLHGTTSGRLASRNPNLQNIVRDREIQGQFCVADKETNIFVHSDYAQAEGRVMTWLAQDVYLQNILSDPSRDLFDELGLGLYNEKFNHDDKDQRVRIKAYFYGLAYGREPYSIAMEYNLPVRQTEIEVGKFKALIPHIIAWQEDVQNRVLKGEDLVTPFGRKRRFYLITEQNRKDVLNEALSFLPQSTSSDICLSALIRLRPMLRGVGWIRLTIHDSLTVECNKKHAGLVAEMVRTVMLEEAAKLQTYVPFKVDQTFGQSWGQL